MQPFLDDDERVECAMYPGGEAVEFIEQGWGGDLRTYLKGFIDALGRDHARWQSMLKNAGESTLDAEVNLPFEREQATKLAIGMPPVSGALC